METLLNQDPRLLLSIIIGLTVFSILMVILYYGIKKEKKEIIIIKDNDKRTLQKDKEALSSKLKNIDKERNKSLDLVSKIINDNIYLANLFTYPLVALYKDKIYTTFTYTKQHGYRVRIKENGKYVSGRAVIGFLVEGTFIRLDGLTFQIKDMLNKYYQIDEALVEDSFLKGIKTSKKATPLVYVENLKA